MGPQDGTTIFTEPVLVVRQKAKYVEINNEYVISNPQGQRLGSVRQVGQSLVKKAFRLFSNWDEDLRHTLQILDVRGDVVLELVRASVVVRFSSRVVVRDGTGNDVGQLVEQSPFDHPFSLESGGAPCGSIVRVPDAFGEYSVRDLAGTEVAHITELDDESMIRGLSRILFTTGNNYVVEIRQPLDDPLRRLVVASPLALDVVFEQGSLF